MTMVSEGVVREDGRRTRHTGGVEGQFVPFDSCYNAPDEDRPLYHRLRFPDPIPVPDDHHADIDPWSDL